MENQIDRSTYVLKEDESLGAVQIADAEVPMAISEALRAGNFGIMDYMNYRNIQADTAMRDSISKVSDDKQDMNEK